MKPWIVRETTDLVVTASHPTQSADRFVGFTAEPIRDKECFALRGIIGEVEGNVYACCPTGPCLGSEKADLGEGPGRLKRQGSACAAARQKEGIISGIIRHLIYVSCPIRGD